MKDFTLYQEALELKQLGFDEDCFARFEGRLNSFGEKPLIFEFTFANLPKALNKVGYPNHPYQDVEAPTYSQAFRFFREKYSMHGYVEGAYPWFRFYINWDDDRCEGHKESTYEEAELACLKKLIEIVKQK
ncbi:hypothetical protein [Microcystis sp. M061S2]|uniref:hypothetical protein n=1 Tax=Microcystis sp. M061S2 TaxID=2771171 RepID=UPI00258C29C4|nr:hypothetical protein [Microcystis sp. M061S2]MCA2656094.1 hypothetical protein [Microcystis sp. M061S2]